MFEMPKLRPYPTIPDITGRPELIGVFSYVIHGYEPSVSILIKSSGGEAGIVVGDWNGVRLDPAGEQTRSVLASHVPKLVEVMKAAGFSEAQYFISLDGSLVDVQLSEQRFMGAGMLRDMFSKQMTTQRVIETVALTPDKIAGIKSDKARYPARMIVKPSRYRFVETTPGQAMPCYAMIGN